MDHVIVTNFEAIVCIYRGESLPALVREVLASELDLSPVELDPATRGLEDWPAAIFNCWDNPTFKNLEEALEAAGSETDVYYSGPDAANT